MDDVCIEYRMTTRRFSGFKEYVLSQLKRRHETRTFRALSGVNFSIRRGESVAFLGHNGCGKSTLLKVIAGIIPPSRGKVTTVGRLAPMIELGAGFDFELSGLENIRLSCMLMGLSREEIDMRLDSIVAFADLGEFIHAPLKNYSSGMSARIGFACATAIDPDVLLVDEVLAVGDTNFTRKCLARIKELRSKGTTVILVTHDLHTVKLFCERGIVLEEGVIKFDGSIIQAVGEHERIMDERYRRRLPVAMQQELERKQKLAATANEEKPRASVQLSLIQDHETVNELDVSRSFQIQLQVRMTDSNYLIPDIAFGIALKKGDEVMTGFNNRDLGFPVDRETFLGRENFIVVYEFENGLQQIEAGVYSLWLGIHDNNISREIFFGKLAEVPVTNSARGINPHDYVFDVCGQISNFSVQN
jgi:ABC-type polysaccharide/polyol phosphate transport system ATPase subunit